MSNVPLKLLFACLCTLQVFLGTAQEQLKYPGYFGKRHFLMLSASYNPRLKAVDKYVPQSHEKVQMEHDWTALTPKLTLTAGWQRSLYRYATLEASFFQMPNVEMRHSDNSHIGSAGTYDSMSVMTQSANFQVMLGFMRYFNIAPSGMYLGINYGLGITPYKYQFSEKKYEVNYSTEGYTMFQKFEEPERETLLSPSFAVRLGRTILLNRRNTLDLGLKSTIFFYKSYKKKFGSDISSKATIHKNMEYMTRNALSSNHLIEFYVSYSLFY